MNPARRDRDAAQSAHEGDLTDELSIKAMQLHSLMVALMHAVRSDDMPAAHVENTCWLACDLARRIEATVSALTTNVRTQVAGRCASGIDS